MNKLILTYMLFFLFLNTNIFAQSDSIFFKPSDELYELGNKFFEKKDFASCLPYYRSLLFRAEVSTYEFQARLNLAYATIQLGMWSEAEFQFKEIIADGITNRDLHHEQGSYKWIAIQSYIKLLILNCRFKEIPYYIQLAKYYEANNILQECGRSRSGWHQFEILCNSMDTLSEKRISDLFGTTLYNNNEIKFSILNEKQNYINLDELLIEILLQKYTMQQIDSALTVPIRLQIDTIIWSKIDTIFNKTTKVENKIKEVSYAPAYYIFMGERINDSIIYIDKPMLSNIKEANDLANKKLTNSRFYQKIKGVLPRQAISNIKCFEFSDFK